MTDNNFETYFEIGSSKIRATAFNKINENENFIIENYCISDLKNKDFNFSKTSPLLEKTIFEIEKKTGEYIDNINLLIDTHYALSVSISLLKKNDGKKIKKEDVEYLIQDAKQQILRAYPDDNIIHIVVNNYKVDNDDYDFLPLDINCDIFSIDIVFICFPKKLIKNIENLFNKHEVFINQIICSSYAKSLNYKEQFISYKKIAFIDIGYEKTSIIFYENNRLKSINFLPIGANHITKDIANVLKINLDKSEQIKINFDNETSIINDNNLSLELVKKIIFARVEEILEISTKFFESNRNLNEPSDLKLILMGEGSKILDNKFNENIYFYKNIDLLDETTLDICRSGLKLVKGINKQEVVIIPKKLEKKGFFVRLFHFFK